VRRCTINEGMVHS